MLNSPCKAGAVLISCAAVASNPTVGMLPPVGDQPVAHFNYLL